MDVDFDIFCIVVYCMVDDFLFVLSVNVCWIVIDVEVVILCVV